MSSRYTASKQGRTHGAYKRRLAKVGLLASQRMTSLRTLRKAAKLSTGDLPADCP